MTVQRIPAAAVLPMHMAHAMTAEAPFWDERDGSLWWIDIQGQRLLRYAPALGEGRAWPTPSMPGLVVGRSGGGFVVGLEDGLHAFSPESGFGPRLVAVEADDPRTRVNDGKVDPHGRLWFGTMDKTGSGDPIGALYRCAADGGTAILRRDVRIPNAICFSPDGRWVYFADSRSGVLEHAPYDADGPGAFEPFARWTGGEAPDGACVDAEGGVWVAIVGGSRIERLTPDGRLDVIVDLPVSRPTMPMLGGADGRTLFVTSQRRFLDAARLRAEPLAGCLLAVRVDAVAAPGRLALI